MISKNFRLALLLPLLMAFVGCQPRGETAGLDTVLSNARGRYVTALKELQARNSAPNYISEVNDLHNDLDSMLDSSAVSTFVSSSEAAAAIMDNLIEHAGYPSRPAFGEIIKEHRSLVKRISSSGELSVADQANIKLLVARSYSILSAELEGAAFSL